MIRRLLVALFGPVPTSAELAAYIREIEEHIDAPR